MLDISNNNYLKMSKLHFLYVLLFLAISFPAVSQKLAVREFEGRPHDLDAQSNTYEKRDRNGKRAALIKIFTSLPSSDLTFGGSGLGFIGQEQHGPGQVWLYVPQASQKVMISHPKYDPLTFHYPVEIKEGNTYSMILTPEGKEVSLSASARNAGIWIDGDSIGLSPVTIYLPYGTHSVKAQLGSLLFDDDVIVEREGPSRIDLPMKDENLKYGDVIIDVENGAELWFQGRRAGIGRYTAHLREDDYVVEARKADHDPATTIFHVEPGKTMHIKAASPTPHLGYLSLTTVPEHGVTVTQADTIIETAPDMQLKVANYEWTFSRKGYYPSVRRFHISRGETREENVVLRKIQYVPNTTAYASLAFSASSMPGISLVLGGMMQGVDLSVSYTLGMGKSKEVDWYGEEDNIYDQSVAYRVDELGVRVGYGLRFAERFGLTPQIGFVQQRLNARGKLGNGFTVNCASIGARLAWHPIPHLGIFLNPEYAIPVEAKGDIVNVCRLAGITRGGIRGSVGVSVNL